MAEFNLDSFNSDQGPAKPDANPNPFEADESGDNSHISHAPLDLGGSFAPAVPAVPKPAAPARKPAAPVVQAAANNVAANEKITGVKIFFTKLHAGAIDFLSEQITEWLKQNPDVYIKHTNAVVGEIAAKKTEPNLIITVWY